MARFYGWNHGLIEKMEADTLESYWLGITVIEAQEAMMGARISSYPWAKKEDQRKFYREMQRLSIIQSNKANVSTSTLAEKLRLAINGQ